MTSLNGLLDDPAGIRREWKESEYAIYKYIPNQETIDRDGSAEETKKPGAGFSLTLVGTSILSDREHFLREHVGTQMARGTLYHSTGQVTTLDPEHFPPVSQTYHCLIDVNEEGTKEGDVEGHTFYLVCFMSIGKPGLDLFRTELDTFCLSLSPLLRDLPEDDSMQSYRGSKLEGKVCNWYDENVLYLSRVVKRCQKQLPALLHIAVDSLVKVSGDDLEVVRDTQRFLDACSLANLMQFNDPAVKVTITEDDCQVEARGTSQFCYNWAQVLLAQGTQNPDPYFLRQAVENYKLKIIQDINALKRLVRQAETDYHSLYRCYMFMCSCGNGHLLLKCALQEEQSMASPETLAVLEAIKTYSDVHGFQNPVNP